MYRFSGGMVLEAFGFQCPGCAGSGFGLDGHRSHR